MLFWKNKTSYDNQSSQHLTNDGERVYLNIIDKIPFKHFSKYQKSHYKRYQFATSLLSSKYIGDFACGTGYGSVLLSQNNNTVLGIDIDDTVINSISSLYSQFPRVSFINKDLLQLDYNLKFDAIVSFETIEHFSEDSITSLLKRFSNSLKYNGLLIFSVPYLQEASPDAIKMGFHKTFLIDENRIQNWFKSIPITITDFFYQNYKNHSLKKHLKKKDFIICIGKKNF